MTAFMEFFSYPRASLALVVLLLTPFLYFLRRLYFYRSLMHNLHGPPHGWLLGSLPAIYEVTKNHPKRAAPQTLMPPIGEKYNLGDYFYLDPWPFGWPMLVIFDADMMNEITVKNSLPKHYVVDQYMQYLSGPKNLVSAEGATWKKWRSVFNPGFSASHLMTLVPVIVDQCAVFCDILTKHAERHELFRMEPATTRLTIDIIGKVVLDLSFDSQSGSNEFVETFINQQRWVDPGAQYNMWSIIDFRGPLMLKYNNWKMQRYVAKRLEERFASSKSRVSRTKSKAIIDLALEAYLKEVKGSTGGVDDVKTLDPEFTEAAISNLKVFIFAGHDTTSSTVCYAYHYLGRHPDILSRVCDELDDVLGPDPRAVPDQLKATPHTLNRLEYLLAVIREVLRLQPPASSMRTGYKGFILRDPKTGKALPCDENFMVYPVDVGFHRSKRYWDDPDTFQPDRFQDPAGYAKDAYVPFSKGVRNCIGQELAVIEIKIILAMTLRSFNFRDAYDELAKLKRDGSGYPSDDAGVQEQYGGPAYQIQQFSAKPREGMPCRLSLKKKS